MIATTAHKLQEVLDRLRKDRCDEEAWMTLYDILWPRVWGSAYRLLNGEKDLAEDAGQETFFRILKYTDFAMIDSPDEFFGYLNQVVRNVARDLGLRELRAQGTTHLGEESAFLELANTGLEFDDESLLNVVSALRPDEQEIVKMLAEGFRLSEIAGALGLSYTNTGVRVHRVRKKLRNILNNMNK